LQETTEDITVSKLGKEQPQQHMVIVMKKTDLYFVLHKRKFVLVAVELRNGADKLAETVKGTTTILSSSTQHRILREQQSAFLVQT
jgi:hypothetical protein